MKNESSVKYILFKVIVLIVISYSPVYAQFPRLNFKGFTEKDGLSKNYVRSIFEDKDGFMWFGTPDGIDKFDGKNFINYNNQLKDTSSNTYQLTSRILEDNDSILWIATYSNGVILFDKNRTLVTHLKHVISDPTSLSNDRVLDIFQDRDANIWVAMAGGGLDLWQKKSRSFIHFRHEPGNKNSIGSDYIGSIASDSKGNIWVLSLNGIISKYDKKTGIFENIVLPLSSHEVIMRRGYSTVIYIDSDDNVLAGSHYGLFIVDSKTGSMKCFPKLNPHFNVTFIITSLLEIQKGIIAIGTTFQGLYLLNTNTGKYINYSNTINADYYLNSNSVTSIYKSKNGLIWLGSWDAGINLYNKEFSQFQILSETVKTGKELFTGTRGASFCKSPDNNIWIATGTKDIVSYDPIEKTAHQVLKNVCRSTINSLYNNGKGEIFIGTSADGLIIYDFWKKTLKFLTNDPKNPNSIASNFVQYILQDMENKVWLSFSGTGLDVWDRSANKITHLKHKDNDQNSLLSNEIYQMIEDRKGRIWIGTQNGLCYFDRNRQSFIQYPLYINKKNSVLVNTVLDLLEDSKGDIWVGASDAIFRINHEDNSSTILSPKNSKPYIVLNIMEDQGHNIWMTSYNKLFKFNRAIQEFSVYNLYNGNTTPSFMGTSSLSANDRFYLGSLDRILTFNPGDIIEDTSKPKIIVTNFMIFNNPEKFKSSTALTENINFAKSIKLHYKQSTFAFLFAAIEYSFPEKIQYAHKLDDFDKNWIYSGNLNWASYTRVPPGKYVLRIMATNRRGDWFESDQTINITITPPLWATVEFKIIMLLLILGIIYSIYFFRVKALRLQKKKLEVTVKKRTSSLNEANASLAEQHEELKQQNEQLSQMSQQILKQKKELEVHYDELERLVDERTLELKEAKNKAEESDKLKSAFLANMSHEIRTPMNAIVGFSNLLKDENLTTEEKNEYVETITSNSDSLLVLVGDILDLSLIEADQLIIRNEIIDVNELLDHLYSAFSLLNSNEKLNLRLNNELHDQKLRIQADKVRIKQILTNLMGNAIKFTNNGFVELGLRMNGNKLVFHVKDTGIGIHKKDIEAIFERFRKSADDKSTFYRGVGLGLAISKALARLMGGNLTVESEFGKGSVFTLLLPDTVISNEESTALKIPVFNDTILNSEKNILVVEDEIANYMYVNKLLSKTNLKVFRAENGLEALKMLESGNLFHLILMDIKMPEMDGFEATKIIKSKNPGQIIIAVTAYALPEEKLRYMKAGFDDYLAKPIKPDEFRSIIGKYIKKS